MITKYLARPHYAPEGAAGGAAGTPAGGAAAGGTPAGDGVAAASAAAGAGAAAGATDGKAFYADWGLDAEATKWIDAGGITEPATIVKRARDFQKAAGDRNVIPKPDVKDPEKLKNWEGHELLGWKKKLEEYTLTAPKLPEGVTYTGDMFEQMRKAMHAAQVPLGHAQLAHDTIWNYFIDSTKHLTAQGAKARSDIETALKNDWGGDFERNSEIARRAIAKFNPTPDDTKLAGNIMGEPLLVKMFHRIGEAIGETNLPGAGAGAGNIGGMSAQQARGERLRLEGDKEWMKVFNDPRSPRQKDYIEQRQRLINIEAGTAR